jgi:RNA recognition motif-containing protein
MGRVLRLDQATEAGGRNRVDKQTTRHSVFIGHVPFDSTEEEIREIFEEACGAIHHVRIPRNDKGQGRGIAYVTFEEDESIDFALKFNGAKFRKQTITVERSNPAKGEKIKMKHTEAGRPARPLGKRAKVGFEGTRAKGRPVTEKKFAKEALAFEGKRASAHDDNKNQSIKTYLKMRGHVKKKRAASQERAKKG